MVFEDILEFLGHEWPPEPHEFIRILLDLRNLQTENEQLRVGFERLRVTVEPVINDYRNLQRQLSQRDERIRTLEAQVSDLQDHFIHCVMVLRVSKGKKDSSFSLAWGIFKKIVDGVKKGINWVVKNKDTIKNIGSAITSAASGIANLIPGKTGQKAQNVVQKITNGIDTTTLGI